MNHRKFLAAAAAWLLFVSAVLSGCTNRDEKNAALQAQREGIRTEAQRYDQETNEMASQQIFQKIHTL